MESKNGLGGQEGQGQPGGQRATPTQELVLLFPGTQRSLPPAPRFPSICAVRNAHTAPTMLERTHFAEGSTEVRKEREYSRGCRMHRKGKPVVSDSSGQRKLGSEYRSPGTPHLSSSPNPKYQLGLSNHFAHDQNLTLERPPNLTLIREF